MVLTILVLLALVLVTPTLIGRPQELASVPLLVVGMTEDEAFLVFDVGAGVQAYMYRNITLEIRAEPPSPGDVSEAAVDAYHVTARVPVNASVTYAARTYLVDRQDNYFEYNVTVRAFVDDDERMVIAFGLVDEDNPSTILAYPPADFRWVVPPRGSL